MAAASLPTGGHRRPLIGRQFRFWVALLILALVFWFLAGALEREAERAERVALKVALNQLRAALVVKGAEIRVSRRGDYGAWVGGNPMVLLAEPLPRYQGLCEQPLLAVGRWCFAPGPGGKGELRYQPGQPMELEGQAGHARQAMTWSVVREYNDRNGNGLFDNNDLATGLKLAAATKRNQNRIEPEAGGPES